MSDPRSSQNAARLSEDIGDVLSAIRRLIAEDEAYAATPSSEAMVNEDAGDFLARRYGGNAELARRLAGGDRSQASRHDGADGWDETHAAETWPLGGLANSPDAARPNPPVPETPIPSVPQPPLRIQRHDDSARFADRSDVPHPRNDLVRSLSASFGSGQDASVESNAGAPVVKGNRDSDVATQAMVPLRLDAARRVVTSAAPEEPAAQSEPARWRAWIRPEPPLQRPAATLKTTSTAAQAEGAGFSEDFDWKARMRPDIEAAAKTQPADVAGDTSAEVVRAVPPAPVTARTDKPMRQSGWVNAASESAAHIAEDGPDFTEVLDALCGADLPDADLRQSDAADCPGAECSDALAAEPSAETVTGFSPEAEEQSIRDLLREMIQEELHGELGERFSRNLRAVIRREVAAAIEDSLERF